MDINNIKTITKVPAIVLNDSNNKQTIVGFLGSSINDSGEFLLKFIVNGQPKAITLSRDDFYGLTGLDDETCPDNYICCQRLDEIIPNDLAEYVIDWELV